MPGVMGLLQAFGRSDALPALTKIVFDALHQMHQEGHQAFSCVR